MIHFPDLSGETQHQLRCPLPPQHSELFSNVCSCRGPLRARWPCCSSAGLQHAAPTGRRPALKLGCGFTSLSHSFSFSSPAFITKSQYFIFSFISLQLGFQSQNYTGTAGLPFSELAAELRSPKALAAATVLSQDFKTCCFSYSSSNWTHDKYKFFTFTFVPLW